MAESKESSSPSISSEDTNIVSIEEADTDSTTSGMHPPARKRLRPKKFSDSWLSDPSFMPWLGKCEGNPYEAKCLVCNRTLLPGRSELKRHSATKSHRDYMAAAGAGMQTGGTTSDDDGSTINTDSVKKTELRYILDIVHYSRSFYSGEHYVPMVHAAHPDCNCLIVSLKKMHFKISKIAAIVKNVLSKPIVETRTRILRRKLFTVLIDESTDIVGVKALCILVRHVHEGNMQSYLLDYVKVKDAEAESLYKYLECSLEKCQLSIKNVIGISGGNACVVLGKKKSEKIGDQSPNSGLPNCVQLSNFYCI